MQFANDDAALCRHELNETLYAAVSMCLPQLFNLEWLIDRAEHGEWSGLWW
ncbi:hypothetical protein ACERZ8_03955 [Tateyamaria armeniaca]|uniref:Uncharacterized protein n=1 Tax=Tateyamaria armeniaca TaxID=2518930 RepID=A0ABW8UTS9_9RHOB